MKSTPTQSSPTSRPLSPLWFSVLSVVVGMVAGFGAVVFRGLIGFFHNAFFLGELATAYDANTHTQASPWGPWVILVPVVGGLGVAFLVKNFAPEARGHGVPEVMDAIYYQRGRIRPVVAVIKALASALSIGSGGSVGREGPIIQIGSSFGSTVGQLLRIPAWQRIALIAGGAGGGIAATFNTPVGGVLFVLEVMMHEVSVRTLVPVVLATTSATYIGTVFFGTHPSFTIPYLETPYFHLANPWVLLSYLGLGTLMGVLSALFIKSIYGCEDFFAQRIGGSYYRQHLLGMLAVGGILYACMLVGGHYYVEGVGYAAIQDVLTNSLTAPTLLLFLVAAKLLATALTLGSGASGGVFSPSLFLGATAGAAYGVFLERFFPMLDISMPAFAVAGMAAMVGGVTGAALAAIVMIFEMTLDYNVILPMTIAVAVSYGVRRVLSRDSVYTLKLVRRGHYMPEALQTSPQLYRRAQEIMVSSFGPIAASTRLGTYARAAAAQPGAVFLLEDGQEIVGYVRSDQALGLLSGQEQTTPIGELVQTDFTTVSEQSTVFDVLSRMRTTGASVVVVTTGAAPTVIGNIRGVITRTQLADAMIEATELFMN